MKDFVAIDFETANGQRSSVCSVGIVIVKDGEIVDNFYSLIKPRPNYYAWFCQEVHGLGYADTDNAPEFPKVWDAAMQKIREYFPKFPLGSPQIRSNATLCSGESGGTNRPNDCDAIGLCDLVAEREGEVPFVAHNAPFDEGCLKAVFAAYEIKYPNFEFQCTCRKSRQIWKEGHHNLDIIAGYCGYDLTHHHHALADAEACAVIGIKIL